MTTSGEGMIAMEEGMPDDLGAPWMTGRHRRRPPNVLGCTLLIKGSVMLDQSQQIDQTLDKGHPIAAR